MAQTNCEFKGSGGEYFLPVFIHLFLINALTLGIYTPWAWVRILKLKASHSTIYGKSVTFAGTGKDLFVIGLTQGLLTVLTFGLYGPWFLCAFFRWRARNTLVGGKSSQFTGTGGSLFVLYLVHLMILPMLTFGLYSVWGMYRFYAWKEEHTLYGGKKTSFGGRFGEFVKVYLVGAIVNALTLNLFTPWSLCMLYKWQIEGLAVGDEAEVQHFPPVRTNLAVVAALLIIGLLPVLALGLVVRSEYMRLMRGTTPRLVGLMKSYSQGKGQGTWKVSFPKTEPQIPPHSEGRKRTRGVVSRVNPSTKTMPASKDLVLDTKISRLNTLIQQNSKNIRAFFERGKLFASTKKWDRAIQDYSHVISLDAKAKDAYYNRGLVYVEMGRYEPAREDFTAAIGLDPEAADAYCNRGNVNFKLGSPELAVLDYTKAIKISPDDGDLYYNRGFVYLSMGEKIKAKEDFKKAAGLGQVDAQKYLRGDRDKDGGPNVSSLMPSQVQWKMDLADLRVPETAARGRIHGKEFAVEKAKLQGGILTLRQGKDFFADRELMIFLFLKKGESLQGRTFKVTRESTFGSPHIHMKWREGGKDLPETEVFVKDYVMFLQIGEEEEGRLPGKIYLCLPDQDKSYVAGTFLAQVK